MGPLSQIPIKTMDTRGTCVHVNVYFVNDSVVNLLGTDFKKIML